MPLLGVYSASFGLADARRVARDFRQKIINGIDPVLAREQTATKQRAEKKAEDLRLQEEAKQGNVSQLFDLYVSHLQASGKRSASEVRRALDRDVTPTLGADTKAKDVEPDNIRAVLTAIVKRGHLVYANRVRGYISAAFSYGLQYDNSPTRLDMTQFGMKYNPVTAVPKALKSEPVGERDLSRTEIRQLWAALTSDESCTFGVATAVKLMLATGLRVQEVVEAKWSEIDLPAKRWELPSSRTKKARAHVVPLNAVAVSLLEKLKLWSAGLLTCSHITTEQRATDRWLGVAQTRCLGAYAKVAGGTT